MTKFLINASFIVMSSFAAYAQEIKEYKLPEVGPDQMITGVCDVGMIKAYALFMSATTHCKHDFNNSPASYVAMAGSRKCGLLLTENAINTLIKESFMDWEKTFKKEGKKIFCSIAKDTSEVIMGGYDLEIKVIFRDRPKSDERNIQ